MSEQHLVEEFSSVEYSKKGQILEFRVDEILLPNGKKSIREYIKHKGAVAVIPIDEQGFVYLVRQFRYAAGRTLLEIPAGKLDSIDEDPKSAAARELREETGLGAEVISEIGEYLGSPAISNELIRLYFAEGLFALCQELDDDEFLDVEKIHIKELCAMVMRGEIADGKTAYAALWADKYLEQRQNNG